MSSRELIGKKPEITTVMYRRMEDGAIVPVEPDYNAYRTPPKGTRAQFELHGISEIFVLDGEYGPKEKVTLEFKIVKTANKALDDLNGTLFRQMFPWPKNIASPKAHFGQFLGTLLEHPIREGERIVPDAFIGTRFVTSTTLGLSADGQREYPGVSWETIEPGSVKLHPDVLNGVAPQPALATAGGDAEPNPFDVEEFRDGDLD